MRFSMGPEINIELIKNLEKQIREGTGDVIKLKRTRNSLLNVSVRVPPEILADIFTWVVVREEKFFQYPLAKHFAGVGRGFYNFLLVCHHWFEVASHTPELWSFWGRTLQEWERRHHRISTAPVDLILDSWPNHPRDVLSARLRDALKDLSTQNKIRQIHLTGDNLELLTCILSSLSLNTEGIQERFVESIVLSTRTLPELSNFFARSRLPKLRYLRVEGMIKTPLWDHLAPQTTRLTTLSLQLTEPSLHPTASQLLSILASNPNLQELELYDAALPDEVGGSGLQVPLPHLRSIDLWGEFHRVFRLLHRLELPETLDHISLRMGDSTMDDILQTLTPYMRNHFQRDIRFQDRLEVHISGFLDQRIGIDVGRVGDSPERMFRSEGVSPSVGFSTSITGPLQATDKLCIDLMALIPQARVVSFKTFHSIQVPEEVLVAMPNIETLWLYGLTLPGGFPPPNPDGPRPDAKLLPSLRHLCLTDICANETSWAPLTRFLARQTSDGQPVEFRLSGDSSRMPRGVAKEIRDLVDVFSYHVNGYGYSHIYGEEEGYRFER